MDKRAENNAEIRKNNNHLVFQSVYNAQGSITKRALAENLGLSLPTVKSCINYLIKNKLLRYGAAEASTGGRKPRTIKLIPNSKISLGMSISANNIRLVAVNLTANILAYKKLPISFEDSEFYYKDLSQKLEEFIAENKLNRNNIIGLAITLPGIINKDNILEYAPSLGMLDKNTNDICQYFNFSTIVVNDANAGGFAEWWLKPMESNMSYLSVEQGVGGAVLIDSKPYYGNNFRSCEFGHLRIGPNTHTCSCGKTGCLEAMCSTDRISKDLGISLEEFFEECSANNPKYVEILNTYLNYLAQGVVAIRVVMDNTIIIGGQIAQFLPPYMDLLNSIVKGLCPFHKCGSFIKLCQIGAKSSCVGAALIWIDKFIKDIN